MNSRKSQGIARFSGLILGAAATIVITFYCGVLFGSHGVHVYENSYSSVKANQLLRRRRKVDTTSLSLERYKVGIVPSKAIQVENIRFEDVNSLRNSNLLLPAFVNRDVYSASNFIESPHTLTNNSFSTSPSLITANLITESRGRLRGVSGMSTVSLGQLSQVDKTSRLKYSFHANSENYVIATSNNLDSEFLLVSAWIFLDVGIHPSMRTIFSNKGLGCEKSSNQYGISMFVNAWETTDQMLHFEYGNTESGCNKLDSNEATLVPHVWYHVGAYIDRSSVMMFVDGKLVASKTDLSQGHFVQSERAFIIGQYEEDKYPLHGNISHVKIYHMNDPSWYGSVISVTKIIQADLLLPIVTPDFALTLSNQAKSTEYLQAWFPLCDLINYHTQAENTEPKQKSGRTLIAVDLVSNSNGKYVIPSLGSSGLSVKGVRFRLINGLDLQSYPTITTDTEKMNFKQLCKSRQEDIKLGMKHVWDNYKRYAWGADELKPISGTPNNNWGGMGMTILDSLDTLWIMDMKDEFEYAAQWVKKSLSFRAAQTVSTFETTIRALGGLLSAFDLSGQRVFLDKATELGNKLIHAFDTNTGIPRSNIDMQQNRGLDSWNGAHSLLAELGTLQVEFRALSHYTGEISYGEKSMKPILLMSEKHPSNGLFPMKVSINDGSFSDSKVTLGAMGDSFYEYLLKVWLQGGRKEAWLRRMYDEAMDGVIEKLLAKSSKSGLAFIADWDVQSRTTLRKMDHLVCFLPGILGLGAYTNPNGGINTERSQRDLAVAKALMYTCREMYHFTSTKIAPEYVEFPLHQIDMEVAATAPFYILRPEVAESLFVLAQLTGETIYREWAWEIWQAIDKNCRVEHGFASLRDVRNRNAGVDDRMESFFTAETMKYLYLAQDIENKIDLLNTYVLNTEAHPMHIFKP